MTEAFYTPEQINDIYASRTEADFEHMRARLRSAMPEEMTTRGAMLAETLLRLRSMELGETFVGPLQERSVRR
ncbi:MAG: hypothetical protein JWO56_2653 [Acidobacteria bacterium]|nr:hypothetical protein [Acidobacteriota bacterium]